MYARIHVGLQSANSLPLLSRYSSPVRRLMLESTHIDLFARLLVYSLTLSRDIGRSRIRHYKNPSLRASFRKAVNSNRSIALKGPDRAIRTLPSLNDVEEEIKRRDHSPFVPYCLNTKKEDRFFFFFSPRILPRERAWNVAKVISSKIACDIGMYSFKYLLR